MRVFFCPLDSRHQPPCIDEDISHFRTAGGIGLHVSQQQSYIVEMGVSFGPMAPPHFWSTRLSVSIVAVRSRLAVLPALSKLPFGRTQAPVHCSIRTALPWQASLTSTLEWHSTSYTNTPNNSVRVLVLRAPTRLRQGD